MENSGNAFLAELLGRAKLLLDGMAAEQNLPLLEIGRRINAMSQVVSLLTDVTGRNNSVVRDQPQAAISPPPQLPAVPPRKMILEKNKPDAKSVMPKPLPSSLTLKSESESESDSSSSEDEATPSKKTRSGGKSPASLDVSGKEIHCQHCTKILSSKYNLKLHIMNKHTRHSEKPFVCEFADCGKRFGVRTVLNKHYKTHFDQFTCTTCGKVFNRKDRLAEHVFKVHQKKQNEGH